MKLIDRTMKCLIATVAALCIFSITQAHAGTVTLTGQVDGWEDKDISKVIVGSPVSLELTWTNNSLVSPIGESEVTFRNLFSNYMTFSIFGVGNTLSLGAEPKKGINYPVAHFTDGLIDKFSVYYFDASLTGSTASNWVVFIGKPVGGADLSFQVYQESTTGDSFWGTINLPEPTPAAPVPLPASVWLFGTGLASLVGLRRKKK